LGIFLLILVPLFGALNFFMIFNNTLAMLQYILLIPLFYFFTIAILAELNRTPFDLPEAESELVSGYNVEYSSLSFALFSLGEYGGIILVSFMLASIFISTVSTFCIVFFSLFLLSFRAFLPRYRYDQLLSLGWNKLIPLIFAYLFIVLVFYLI
jgi:NADH-quinone oxidoreductase subunit H